MSNGSPWENAGKGYPVSVGDLAPQTTYAVAPRGDRSWPLVGFEYDTAQETTPPVERLVVEALEEAQPGDTTGNLANRRADPLAVAAALHAGRPAEQTFSWDGTQARVQATPEMVPPGAPAHESGSETAGSSVEKTFKYARLRPILGVPSSDAEARSGGAQLERLVEAHRDTPFSVTVHAAGVPLREHAERVKHAATRVANAGRSTLDPYAQTAGAISAEELKALQDGRVAGLGRETIVVGASPKDLEGVAGTAATTFRSQRSVRYEVERDQIGAVRTFDDVESAVSQATGGGQLLVTGDDLAERATLPEQPLVGLGRVGAPTNFDLENPIPPGVRKVTFADILDNRGRPTGKPMEMTREHTAIFAENEAGKSVLLRAIGVDIQRQNQERRRAALAAGETVYDHEALVYIDCKKRDNFSHILSRQIAGAGTESGEAMPADMATIHHFVPGADGPGVRFNLLRAVHDAPEEWRTRIATAVEIMASKYLVKGPEIYGAVKKHLTKSLYAAVEMFGINSDTGKAKFPYALPPYGTPATPTGEFAAALVDETAKESGLRGDYYHNVVGWVKDEIKLLFTGNNGAPLSAEGYDFDPIAALDNQGVTSMDLVGIRDAGARQVTVLAALYDLFDACVEKNRLEGIIGETSKIRVTVVVDEADVFGKDSLGAALADFFTHARSVGMRIVFAKQGDLDGSLHPQVLINTPNKIMLRTSHEPDLATFAAGAGLTTLADMKHLAGAPKGMGVYKGPNRQRGVRFRVRDPNDPVATPMAAISRVVGPEALIDTRYTIDVFTHTQRAEARSFLQREPLGLEIRNWAEACATYVAAGRPLANVGGELAAVLRPAINDNSQRAAMRAAITEAVVASIDSRPELQYVAPRAKYIRHNLEHMLAIAEGKHLSGWNQPRPDLALTAATYNNNYNPGAEGENGWKRFDVTIDGHFAPVKDRLNDQMTAARHASTPEFERALGIRLHGNSAEEQRDVVVRSRMDTVLRIGQALRPSAEKRPSLTDDIARLVGGQITSSSEAEIRAEAQAIVAAHITQLREAVLSSDETAALASAIQRTPISDLKRQTGFTAVERQLDQAIAARRESAPALSPQAIAELVGFDLRSMTETQAALVAGKRAIDQFDIVERRLEQEYVAGLPYAARVQSNRIFFAFDPLASGATLDNTLAAQQSLQIEDGPIHAASRKGSTGSTARDHSLGAQLAAGDYTAWKTALSRRFAYSNSIVPGSVSARRFFVRGLDRITKTVWSDAAARRARVTA